MAKLETDSIRIEDVARDLGFTVKNGQCSCPAAATAHKGGTDKHPSCTLGGRNPALFHCKTCGATGDAVHFVMLAEGRDQSDAIDYLRQSGFLPKRNGSNGTSPPPADPIATLAARRRWAESALLALGAKPDGREVHFPMRDATGAVVGWRRRMGDGSTLKDGKKALSVYGSANCPIFPHPLPDGVVLMVEGEADAAAAISAGWAAVVATPGADLSVKTQEELQRMLAGRNVVLAPDPDPAGEKWADLLGKLLRSARATVSVIPPLPGMDLDKRLSRAGAEAESTLIELVDSVLPPPAPRRASRSFVELMSLPEHDENEIIRNRFMCLGSLNLLIGPTGIGKSSLAAQLAACWAMGQPAFDMEPTRPLRSVFIQAENDDHDLREMACGVAHGMDFSPAQLAEIHQRVYYYTDAGTRGDALGPLIDRLIAEHQPDILWLDPAFAYLGGDASKQEVVTGFMRGILQPRATDTRTAMMIVHHTNKPPQGKEKANWAAGDNAYLGAGSAEWVNPARAAIALKSVGSNSIFEFIAAKRGRRLRWRDDDNQITTSRYIAHHREPGIICWRTPDQSEVEEVIGDSDGPGRKSKAKDSTVISLLRQRGGAMRQTELVGQIMEAAGCARSSAYDALTRLEAAGRLFRDNGLVALPIGERAEL